MWIILFECTRIGFLFANFTETRKAGINNFFGSLLHGLRMDMAMAGYITIPVCFLILVSVWVSVFRKANVYKIYSALIIVIIILITVADVPLYKAWGYRFDATALRYMSNPKEVWATVSNQPLLWMFIGIVLMCWILIRVFHGRIRNWIFRFTESKSKILSTVVILLLIGLFIIPMRGGLQLAPINQSSVYFSKNNFSNVAAINAPFNFLLSLAQNADYDTNPFQFMPDNEAEIIVSGLQNHQSVILDSSLIKQGIKPNVIIVIWESFTKKATEINHNGIEVTPCFNRLKNEGVYFSDIYASGDRTDKGIVAVLSGYPAQPITSIVKVPAKASKLPTLPAVYKQQGYHTMFFYGGEPEFANMKAYLAGSRFDQFTDINNFDKKDLNSKWGAHDGVVMKKVFDEMNKARQPFFCNWLTLTSHEPFETPVPTVIAGNDDESLFLNSLHYSDSILNVLVSKCMQQPWWSNTVMVIVADHGHPLPASSRLNDFKIPLLLLGGALNKPGSVINSTGSQTDIAATLLGSSGIDHRAFKFSNDLAQPQVQPYAYMSFMNGFGFVTPGGYLFYDNIGKQVIESGGSVTPYLIQTGKAFEQVTFADYMKK